MGKIVKQSFFTTISSYIGVVVGYVNVLWLLPYALSPEEIGLFKTIQDMGLLLVPFAQLGLGNGITRFYPTLKENQFAFFTLSLIISTLGFLLVGLLFFAFREYIVDAYQENSPQVIKFLGVVLLITFCSVLNTFLDAICPSFLKIFIPSFFRDVFLRIMISILVICYFFNWVTFQNMIWGLSVVYLITMLIMGIYMVKSGILRFDSNFQVLPKPIMKEFLQYSFITLLATTGALLISKIDSLMVTSMIGLDANAIYAIGFAMAVVIEMPRRAISQVIMPVIAEKVSTNVTTGINSLYKKVGVNQSLICILIFLLIWVNVDNLYYFIPNKEVYQAGK